MYITPTRKSLQVEGHTRAESEGLETRPSGGEARGPGSCPTGCSRRPLGASKGGANWPRLIEPGSHSFLMLRGTTELPHQGD